jgi:hypothetical protein
MPVRRRVLWGLIGETCSYSQTGGPVTGEAQYAECGDGRTILSLSVGSPFPVLRLRGAAFSSPFAVHYFVFLEPILIGLGHSLYAYGTIEEAMRLSWRMHGGEL